MQTDESGVAGKRNKRVFLCQGADWGRHPSSISHIFRIIARTEPVIWINSIGQRSPSFAIRDIKRMWEKGSRAVRQSLYTSFEYSSNGPRAVIEPKVVPYHQSKTVRRINSWILERQLRPILDKWVDNDTDLIFVTSNPAAVDLVGRFGAFISIYYCMDEYAEMRDSDANIIRTCEPLILEAVDCTLTTSLMLRKSKRSRFYETLYLPQGVDVEHFQGAIGCPLPLRSIPHPIIGFQGIVGERIDLVLFEKILRCFPDASLVTVGKQEVDLSHLRRYPNFYPFEAVPYAELPQWVSQFDIGLIAYVKDGHTDSVNPLKLLEYLAMGQAVISVDLPELVRHEDYVTIAADHDTYLDGLAKLLKQYPFSAQDKQRWRQYAQNESWENRARSFLEVCDDLAKRKRARLQHSGHKEKDKVAALEHNGAGGALLYHDVVSGKDCDSSGFLGPDCSIYKLDVEIFDAHLTALCRVFPRGPVVVRDASPFLTEVPFMLTFDDGGASSANEIAECLERFGWFGHFFITTNKIGQRGFLSKEKIRELDRQGHAIGSHSVSHPVMMSALSLDEMLKEWKESIEVLSDVVGRRIQLASVPGGYCSRQVVAAAGRAGVRFLWTSEPTRRLSQLEQIQVIGRYAMHRTTLAQEAVDLAGYSKLAQFRRWLHWNGLQIAKKSLGRNYPVLRKRILTLTKTAFSR